MSALGEVEVDLAFGKDSVSRWSRPSSQHDKSHSYSSVTEFLTSVLPAEPAGHQARFTGCAGSGARRTWFLPEPIPRAGGPGSWRTGGRTGRLPRSATGVAVADLRVEDATLADAQSAFRAAGSRLGPVVRALKGLDSGVVGAPPLAGKLQDADDILAAELGIIGQALAELAAHASQINAAFGQADQTLSVRARTLR